MNLLQITSETASTMDDNTSATSTQDRSLSAGRRAVSEATETTQETSQPDAGPKTNSSASMGKVRKPRFKKIEHNYPVEPRVVQVVKKPKTYMDHTYRDFSQVPREEGYVHPTKIENMTFAQKVHHMLSDETISHWIHWLPHGRAFKIAVPKRLEQSKTLQTYFGHNRYSSFLRQLNNHGFKHLTKGPDRNAYYHECMLEGMPHLTKYMPPGRDARRLMADPDNEPDFYAISRLFPLKDSSLKAPTATAMTGNMGLGVQGQLNPLFGGTSNFQHLSPGLLGMPTTTTNHMNSQQTINADNSAGTAVPGLTNIDRFMTMNMGLPNSIAHQGFAGNQPMTLPAGPDPQLIAALLQQQHPQQQQSTQRAQSSFMRYR